MGLLLCNPCFSNNRNKICNGDLIFQESISTDLGKAIKSVTSSIDNYNFTHVGIVYINENADTLVLEATKPKVKLTPLNEYLSDNDSIKSVVFRLKEEYRHLIPLALVEGLKHVGKDYDNTFILNNDKYYCSEIIYEIFLKSNNNAPLFELNTMTFKRNNSDNYLEEWIEYFNFFNSPIPEGELGINPGAMSKSKVIDKIYDLY